MLRVTPVYGSRFSPHGAAAVEPSCTLYEFAGCRWLVNVGWRDDCDWWGRYKDDNHNNNNNNNNNSDDTNKNDTTNNSEISASSDFSFPEHDFVVLTDSTLRALGGLPVYYEWHRRRYRNTNTNNSSSSSSSSSHRMQIYATFPTVKMGQMTLYDQHALLAMDGKRPPFSLQAVDEVCSAMTAIKYSQPLYFSPSLLSFSSPGAPTTTQQLPTTTTTTQQSQSQHKSLCLTAHRAGHVIGAAFFVAQHCQDETVVWIAEGPYHMAKEMLLDPCTMQLQHHQNNSNNNTNNNNNNYKNNTTNQQQGASVASPTVFVVRPGGPAFGQLQALASLASTWTATLTTTTTKQQQQQPTRDPTVAKTKQRLQKLQQFMSPLVSHAQRHLTETVLSVLRRDGNVLLPVDGSGRVLELLVLLQHAWDQQRLHSTYNLIWLAPMCANVLEFGKSQLEWMALALGTQFDNHGGTHHPLTLPSVRLCTSVAECHEILNNNNSNTNTNGAPTCVLASGLGLEAGPARDMFLKWAGNPDNAIVFTDSSQCLLRPRPPSSPPTSKSQLHNPRSTTTATRSTSSTLPSVVDAEDSAAAAATTRTSSVVPLMERTGDDAIHGTGDPVTATQSDDRSSLYRSSSSSISGVGPTDNSLLDSHSPDAAVAVALVAPEDSDEDEGVTPDEVMGETLTEATKSPWTTAGQLLQVWARAQADGTEMEDSIWVDVNVPVRAPLAGPELVAFLAQEESSRLALQQAKEKQAMLAQVELAKGQLHLGEEETTAPSMEGGNNMTNGATTSTTTATGTRPKKKSRFDSTLFLKYSKPLHLTFAVQEDVASIGQADTILSKYAIGESAGSTGDIVEDDYGVSVKPELFTDIVSGVDPSKFAGGSGRIGEDVARRGLGFDLLDGNNIRGGGGNKSSRIVSDENDGDDNEDLENGQGLDEAAFEALDLSEGNGIIRGRHGRPPTKVGTVPRKVEVLAEVSYIPGLEGRVDARAARQSVRALQPREVIVLGGVPTSNDYSAFNSDALVSREVKLLAEAVQSFASISNSTSKNSTSPKIVWTPSNGETAILAVGHAAYSARLVDTPYRTMEEKLANEHDLMSEERKNMLEPVEVNVGGCNVSLVDCVATGQKVALDNSIVLAPRCHQSSSSSFHNGDPVNDEPSIYLSDGEILLTDLRAELIGLGMKAEYSTISTLTAAEDGVAAYSYSQQLLVNGKIVVRKGQSDGAFTGQHSHVHVEGPLCQDFYTVRGIVCGQYVTL